MNKARLLVVIVVIVVIWVLRRRDKIYHLVCCVVSGELHIWFAWFMRLLASLRDYYWHWRSCSLWWGWRKGKTRWRSTYGRILWILTTLLPLLLTPFWFKYTVKWKRYIAYRELYTFLLDPSKLIKWWLTNGKLIILLFCHQIKSHNRNKRVKELRSHWE